ncbi:MAG: L-2-hydroxyglutarate oxidase [Candidatus Baltobacteraceae bacterium]
MTYDLVVVGGGIVGLATTREFATRFPRLRIANVEKELRHGRHQTGHNSGVVHSGLYYAPGSRKARLCTDGRERLYAYCEATGIPFRRVGKLIVATVPSELDRLAGLYERGRANAVPGLELLDAAGIRAREPEVRGLRAIFSPSTGIVDFGAVAEAFANDARALGADLFVGREVRRLERRPDGIVIHTPLGEIVTRKVVTCGGLYADRLARMTGAPAAPKIVPFRGDYLLLRSDRRGLVQGNVYPVPDPAFPFLGVHFSPRIDGSVLLGPNAVLAFAREGYAFSRVNLRDAYDALGYPGFIALARKHWRSGAFELYRDIARRAFVRSLQRYVPALRYEDCLPGPSGVRAQALAADGSLVDDFVFEAGERTLHVRNAPSPAATSSLAIARAIADEAAQHFGLPVGESTAALGG